MMVGFYTGHFSAASKLYAEQFEAMSKAYPKLPQLIVLTELGTRVFPETEDASKNIAIGFGLR